MSELSFNVLAEYVLRNPDGTLDEQGTIEKFSIRLMEYEALASLETDKIAEAVHAVFDKYPGVTINMDAIATTAMPALNATPDNHNILKERIKDYIRVNADRSEKKDKAGVVLVAGEPARTRLFVIAKGKGGGVKRWSDHPEKPVAGAPAPEAPAPEAPDALEL